MDKRSDINHKQKTKRIDINDDGFYCLLDDPELLE